MKNIKEIICDNLIALRKSNNYTQIELSKKINYSDKAISRWENGEVSPDYETLQTLCNLYNVPLSFIFEEHEDFNKVQTEEKRNKSVILGLAICTVWTFLISTFAYLITIQNINWWQSFVWGLPVTSLILLYYNAKFYRKRTLRIIFSSILLWTLITSLYLQFLSLNIWILYIVGIPIQIGIVFASFLRK